MPVALLGFGDAVNKAVQSYGSTQSLKVTRTGAHTVKVKLPKSVAASLRNIPHEKLRDRVQITLEHLKDTRTSVKGHDLVQVNQNTAVAPTERVVGSGRVRTSDAACDEQWCTTFEVQNQTGFYQYLAMSGVQCVWTVSGWNSSSAYPNGMPNGGTAQTSFNVSSETTLKPPDAQQEFVSQVVSAAVSAGEAIGAQAFSAALFAASDGTVGTGYAAAAKSGGSAILGFLKTIIEDAIGDSCAYQVKEWSTAWTALAVDPNSSYQLPNWAVMDSTTNMANANSVAGGFVDLPSGATALAPGNPGLNQYIGATSAVTWGWVYEVVTPGGESSGPQTGSYFTGPFTAVSWYDQSVDYSGSSSKDEGTPAVFLALGFNNYFQSNGAAYQVGPVPQPASATALLSSSGITCSNPAQWTLYVPWLGQHATDQGNSLPNWPNNASLGTPNFNQSIAFWTMGGDPIAEDDFQTVTEGFPPYTGQLTYNSYTSGAIGPVDSAGCTVSAFASLTNSGLKDGLAQYNFLNLGWNSYPPLIGTAPSSS